MTFHTYFFLWMTIILVFGWYIGSVFYMIVDYYPRQLYQENHEQCLQFLGLAEFPVRVPQVERDKKKLACRILQCGSALLPVIIFLHFGFTVKAFLALTFSWCLLVLSMIDVRYHLLPDIIVYVLLWLGLLSSLFSFFTTPDLAIWGAITGYLLFWLVAKSFYWIRKKEGLGLGDCKMLAMLGAWVGINHLLNVVAIAAILALLAGAFLLWRKKISMQQPLPFGPFLALAGWLTLMYGSILVRVI